MDYTDIENIVSLALNCSLKSLREYYEEISKNNVTLSRDMDFKSLLMSFHIQQKESKC